MPVHKINPSRKQRGAILFVLMRVIFALSLIAGCYSLALNARQASYSSQQKRTDQMNTGLAAGQPLIQSFRSERAYLTSLVFYASRLQAESDIPGASLTVRLRHPGAKKDLAVGQFYLGAVDVQEMLTFSFPALANSKGATYEFVIESNLPAGSVGIWTSAENDYGEGNLFQSTAPLESDLTLFSYYRAPIFSMLTAATLNFFFNMLALLAFYLALGWILLLVFDFTQHETPLDLLAALLGMSMAFPPVLLALMSAAGIKINLPSLAWALSAVCALALLAGAYRWKILGRKLRPKPIDLRLFFGSQDWFFWSVAAILVYALLARAAQADGLYVPNWIDGLVHQRSLDKILETGAQSSSQIYHAGFYAHVILSAMLTGLSTPKATLVCAQLFSALGGVTFLFLASRFITSRFALLLSAVTYWFLASFPAYLLNWSRFPLLLGLALLPCLMVYSMALLRTARRKLIFPTVLIFTGLLQIHYGVTLIFLGFLVVWLISDSESRGQLLAGFKKRGWLLLPGALGLLLPALILLGPKLMRFLLDSDSRQKLVALSQQATAQIDTLHVLKLSAQNGGILMWLMAGVGLVAALVYARKPAYLLIGWFALLWAITQAQIYFFGLAVSSLPNLVISASIPLSILAGFSVETLFAPTPRLADLFEKIHIKPGVAGTLSLLVVIFAGSYSQLGTVNPIPVLFTERDALAAQWIRDNTSLQDVILVDSFRWGQTYWPSDGGGWLKPLTGRQITYAKSAQDISAIDELIASQNVRFVFLGQGYGELSERHFMENPVYMSVYQAEGVHIFTVNQQP